MKKMYKLYFSIFVFLLFLISPTQVFALDPTFDWAYFYGEESGSSYLSFGTSEKKNAIITDNDGNMYGVGIFEGTVDFDPGAGTEYLTSVSGYDIFILKLDSNGDFVWVKQINSADESEFADTVGLDADNNLYIGGIFQSTTDFDPGVGTTELTDDNGNRFILKLNSNGDFVWVVQGYGILNDMFVDNDGNQYITGYFEGTVDFDPGAGTANLTSAGFGDVFILKLDSNGDYVWAKKVGGTGNDSNSYLDVDSNGDVYITGTFSNTVDFDPGAGTANLTSAGNIDVFILKLDSNGDYVWAKKVGGTGTDYYPAININDIDNHVYITGAFSNTVDFDPGAGTANLTSAGSRDVFILKLDSNGDYVWAKKVGGTGTDVPYALKNDNSGYIYVGILFVGSVDFDPGASTVNLSSTSGQQDNALLKLDSSGDYMWAGSFPSESEYEEMYGMYIDTENSIYIYGDLDSSPIDLDPSEGEYIFNSSSYYGYFMFKLYTEIQDETAPTISNIIGTGSQNSFSVTWTTDEESSSKVYYGLNTSYGSNTTESDTSPRVTTHTVTVTGLDTCTQYNYKVYSADAAGNASESSNNFVRTECPTVYGSISSGNRKQFTVIPAPNILNTNTNTNTQNTKSVFNSTRNLKQGLYGDDVIELQKYLNNNLKITLVLDGKFGPKTKQAVILFQSSNGITADGIVGPITKSKM